LPTVQLVSVSLFLISCYVKAIDHSINQSKISRHQKHYKHTTFLVLIFPARIKFWIYSSSPFFRSRQKHSASRWFLEARTCYFFCVHPPAGQASLLIPSIPAPCSVLSRATLCCAVTGKGPNHKPTSAPNSQQRSTIFWVPSVTNRAEHFPLCSLTYGCPHKRYNYYNTGCLWWRMSASICSSRRHLLSPPTLFLKSTRWSLSPLAICSVSFTLEWFHQERCANTISSIGSISFTRSIGRQTSCVAVSTRRSLGCVIFCLSGLLEQCGICLADPPARARFVLLCLLLSTVMVEKLSGSHCSSSVSESRF